MQAETTPDPPPPDPPPETQPEPAQPQVDQHEVQRQIDQYRHETWHWQRLMGNKLTRQLANPPADSQEKIAAWRRVALSTRERAQNPPHRRQWLCIHHFEGAWTSNTGNGYYGGLQMDLSFQRTYAPGLLGRKGTADHWTPLEQMWAAEKAHRSGRGFYPWPNTARYCGFI